MLRIITLCLLVTLVALLAAEAQVDTSTKQAIDSAPGRLPRATREAPEVIFATEPQPIQTTFFDYMPGSYNSCPIQVQELEEAGNNGVYFVYHVMDTAGATRRERIGYWKPSDQTLGTFYIGNTDCKEGYGGIDLDYNTDDPMVAWHIDPDGDGVYNIAFNMDMYHMVPGPGLIGSPFIVVPNDDWGSISFVPPFDDDEFIWPYVFVSESPTFSTDGSRRVYVIGNNSTNHAENPSENVIIAYADYTDDTLDSGEFSSLEWNYTTIPLLDEWNAGPDWIRPFQCPAVTRDGKLAFFGYTAGDDPPITYPFPDMYVLWNDNFAEGDWDYISVDSEQWVDNPLNQDNTPAFPGDSLHFSFTHSGHFASAFDGDDRLHVPSCFALCGISDDTGEDSYWEWYLFMRDIVFDPAVGTFTTNNLYPQGEGPLDEPYLPWDENHDGAVDEFDDEGNVVSVNGWPIAYFATDSAFHENNFKIAANPDHGIMAAVWSDGLKSRMYQVGGDEDYIEWATVPEIYIAISNNNGDTWSEPAALNSIETPELDGMIPVYIYPGNKLEVLDDETARMHMFFLDDNGFGAFAGPTPNGPNDGGTLMYAAVDIDFGTIGNENTEVPEVTHLLRQNQPNPFNPTTTIRFSLPAPSDVELAVYNVRGERVKTLLRGARAADDYAVTWQGRDDNGSPVASGVYFYQLKTSSGTETRKMILLK